MWCFRFIAAVYIVVFLAANAPAATYVPVDDEIYDVLSRLEAEGLIRSALLSTKPISRSEAVRLFREATRKSQGQPPFIKSLLNYLERRLKDDLSGRGSLAPMDIPFARYVYADSGIPDFYFNNEGVDYQQGSGLDAGFSSRAEHRWVSFRVDPEVRLRSGDTDLLLRRVYGVVGLSSLDLTAGKDSQWWGPGHHGAILLSNNPRPLSMVRLANPSPAELPWLFRYLGPFGFTFFVSRLEENRDVPKPYLWGLRFDLKPLPWLEIGLQRTALLGGKGRSENLETWWKSFTAEGENDVDREAGDQRAGGDIKITLPFQVQPVQLYLEAAGEDQTHGHPSKWAYLTGIYFPRIFSLERLELRAEYATNAAGRTRPGAWYTHHIYTSGYTYKGRIIGHHMGTDSEDIYIEARYHLRPEYGTYLKASYDRENHNLVETITESSDEYAVGMAIALHKAFFIKVDYRYAKVENFDTIEGVDRDINILTAEISYIP